MHDAPRIGGITPFLQVAEAARRRGLVLAPHFVMELHIHLAAAYEHVAWVEHFEWLEPLFEERLEISGAASGADPARTEPQRAGGRLDAGKRCVRSARLSQTPPAG